MSLRILCLALAGALLGCADDAAPSGPVLLTGSDVYVTDGGEVDVVIAPTDVIAFALGPDGDVQPLALRATAAGLMMDDAPDGTFYLRRGDIIVATDARQVDVGSVMLGRSDAAMPSTNTPVSFELSNLDPAQDGDAVQLYSVGAGLWSPQLALPDPGTDPTTATVEVDFAAQALPLVEGAVGDRLHITQFRQQTVAGHAYLATVGSTTVAPDLPSLDPIVAALEPGTAASLDLDWRIAEFDRVRTDTQPVAITAFYDLYVSAMPGAAAHGQYGAAADLISMRAQDLDDQLTASLAFADPYPTTWQRIVTTVAWYPVNYTLPNAAATTLWDGMWLRALWTGGAVTATPDVGPPSDVHVDWSRGLCVSWAPPLTGAATYYQLTFYDTVDDGGTTRLVPAADGRTRGTRFCLSPTMLDPAAGGAVVQVASVTANAAAPSHPFATSLPDAYAETSLLAP